MTTLTAVHDKTKTRTCVAYVIRDGQANDTFTITTRIQHHNPQRAAIAAPEGTIRFWFYDVELLPAIDTKQLTARSPLSDPFNRSNMYHIGGRRLTEMGGRFLPYTAYENLVGRQNFVAAAIRQGLFYGVIWYPDSTIFALIMGTDIVVTT